MLGGLDIKQFIVTYLFSRLRNSVVGFPITTEFTLNLRFYCEQQQDFLKISSSRTGLMSLPLPKDFNIGEAKRIEVKDVKILKVDCLDLNLGFTTSSSLYVKIFFCEMQD